MTVRGVGRRLRWTVERVSRWSLDEPVEHG